MRSGSMAMLKIIVTFRPAVRMSYGPRRRLLRRVRVDLNTSLLRPPSSLTPWERHNQWSFWVEVMNGHNPHIETGRPDRDVGSIRRKCRVQVPGWQKGSSLTGDPHMPPEVRRAKRVNCTMIKKLQMVDAENQSDKSDYLASQGRHQVTWVRTWSVKTKQSRHLWTLPTVCPDADCSVLDLLLVA